MEETYEMYCRWAIGPLMTREQWDRDTELLLTDIDAWNAKHGIG